MNAAIVAIGDEIVLGLTIDTNSPHLADALRGAGVEVLGGFSVTDDTDAIRRTLARALEDADLVVTTGGLGPTADDLTAAAVAALGEVPLELHGASLATIGERFRARGLTLTENNRKQALFPAGAKVIPNPLGTAPGFVAKIHARGHVFCLPGVPSEMEAMTESGLLPWVRARQPDRRFASRVYGTIGLTESRLDELLANVVEPGEARLAFRAAFPRIQARVTVSGRPGDGLDARLDAIEARLRERLGAHLYTNSGEGMEEVVGRLLREHGLSLAIAESCTGGFIGDRVTDVPGSSDYLLLGIVAYSNAAKQALLGVDDATLAAHGAVSVETAEAMAQGAREAAGSDLAIATTGIAGPGGGSADKPVGTVCIAIAWNAGVASRRYALPARGRRWIKEMTAELALNQLRLWLLDRRPEDGTHRSERIE